MKKLVTILAVFAVMVIAMICEVVFVNDFYNGVQEDLTIIAESIENNENQIDNVDMVALCEKLMQKWEKGKDKLLMIQNHNTVRNFDEKLVSLEAVVKSNNYNDAVIFVRSAINFIDDVLLDSIPYMSNIL